MRSKRERWYRRPHTHNEAVQNQDEELVRPKRKHLPNSYDDIPIQRVKTKKDFHKTTHAIGKRGRKHIVEIEDWQQKCKLVEYLEQHNIPHREEPLYKSEVVIQEYYEYCKVAAVKVPLLIKDSHGYHQAGYRETYRYRKKPELKQRRYRVKKLIGYRITWWSNKDIGVDFIIK